MFGAGKMRKGARFAALATLSFEVELRRFPDDLEDEFETLDGRVAHDVRFGEEAELGKAGRARSQACLRARCGPSSLPLQVRHAFGAANKSTATRCQAAVLCS